MRHLTIALLSVTALTGCAHGKPDAAPVCDGRHLRPANPYGSVLAPDLAKPPAAPPANAAPPAPAASAPHTGCGR